MGAWWGRSSRGSVARRCRRSAPRIRQLAADRARARLLDRTAGAQRGDRLAQVVVLGDLAVLAEAAPAVVDAAEVLHAVVRQHGRLGRDGGADGARELLLRVEHDRQRQRVFARVLARRGGVEVGIAVHQQEVDRGTVQLLPQLFDRGRVGVRDRTVVADEHQHAQVAGRHVERRDAAAVERRERQRRRRRQVAACAEREREQRHAEPHAAARAHRSPPVLPPLPSPPLRPPRPPPAGAPPSSSPPTPPMPPPKFFSIASSSGLSIAPSWFLSSVSKKRAIMPVASLRVILPSPSLSYCLKRASSWSPKRDSAPSAMCVFTASRSTVRSFSSAGTTISVIEPISSVDSRPQRTRLGGLLGLFGLSLLLS